MQDYQKGIDTNVDLEVGEKFQRRIKYNHQEMVVSR